MPHKMKVQLEEGFTDGLFIIQPSYSEEEFGLLMQDKLPPAFQNAHAEVYRDFAECKSGTIVCDDKSPWVIVVFDSDPVLIRRRSLHDIAHLAKAIRCSEELRYRFASWSIPQSRYRRRQQ